MTLRFHTGLHATVLNRLKLLDLLLNYHINLTYICIIEKKLQSLHVLSSRQVAWFQDVG